MLPTPQVTRSSTVVRYVCQSLNKLQRDYEYALVNGSDSEPDDMCVVDRVLACSHTRLHAAMSQQRVPPVCREASTDALRLALARRLTKPLRVMFRSPLLVCP